MDDKPQDWMQRAPNWRPPSRRFPAWLLPLFVVIVVLAIVAGIWASIQASAQAEKQKLLTEAQAQIDRNDYEAAAATYAYAAMLFPDDSTLVMKAAQIQSVWEAQQADAQKANAKELVVKANSSLAKCDYEKAVSQYEEAVRLMPSLLPELKTRLSQAYCKHGEHLLASGKWEEVQSWYDRDHFKSDAELRALATHATKRSADAIKEQRRKIEIETARRQRVMDIEQMSIYEGEPVAIAVADVELRRSMSNSTANEGFRFVLVCIAAKNVSDDSQHVNPNDFTLSDSDGFTVSHDSETYGLSNYFNAVTLAPGRHTSGWLVFLTTKDSEYTLNRNDFSGNIEKRVIVQ